MVASVFKDIATLLKRVHRPEYQNLRLACIVHIHANFATPNLIDRVKTPNRIK